jgi:hypothetical protein
VVRIVRVKPLTTGSPKTPRGVMKGTKSGSFHDESQLTRRTVKSKTSVRRLHVIDPTSPTFSPVMEQFTNNLNPRYDPTKAPGSVARLDGTPQPPKGPNSGHQKVIQQTRQMKTGGKTLVRRTF